MNENDRSGPWGAVIFALVLLLLLSWWSMGHKDTQKYEGDEPVTEPRS